jgi:hypothetical protein
VKIKVNDAYGKVNLAEWLAAKLERSLKRRHYEIIVQVCYWICVAIVAALILREALR